MHFGHALRLLRLDAGLTLRDLAGRIGVSSAYLSRVEHGHDASPTPDRLVAIARALELPPLVLIELAQQAGPLVASYMERVPAAGALFLDIARRDLTGAEVARLRALVDREFPRSRAPAAQRTRLGDWLTPARVIIDLVGDDMSDVVEVAIARLGLPGGAAARAAASQILAREDHAPSLLGSGVVAPHAIGAGLPSLAALVTLGRPLHPATPDARPVKLAIVAVTSSASRSLELMAHVARLASRGLADEVCGAGSPELALERLEALESW